MLLAGVDQTVDHRDQPCVQQRGQRAFRTVQPRRQFMRARYRQAGARADHAARGLFMRRVAGGELGGDGDRADPLGEGVQSRFQRRDIQRSCLVTRVLMAAGHFDQGIIAQRLVQRRARLGIVVKTDYHQPGAAALAFDQRVGGQRGRQRDHRHVLRANCGRTGQHRVDRRANTQCQIRARCQRLGLGQDGLRAVVEQHGIGVGATGINPQKYRHYAPAGPPKLIGRATARTCRGA